MIAENKNCCDEVWFSTGIGIPPLEWHAENAARIARGAEELHAIGIVSGLQIQATIGHADEVSAMERTDGKTWRGWTGRGGTECLYCNCPRQSAFLDYIRRMTEIYASSHPSSVWIDDDLRIVGHSPAAPWSKANEGWVGCWCDTCIAAFNAETGGSWTRETLDKAMTMESELFRQWKAFSERSVIAIAQTIGGVFQRISPQTMLALQHGSTPNDATINMLRTLHEASGKSVGSRPGGGAYYDIDPNSQIIKSMMSVRFRRDIGNPEWISTWTPEIETCPRNYGSRSAQSVIVEAFSALMGGMNAVSLFVTQTGHESEELYSRTMLQPLADASPVLKGYASDCEGAFPAGFSCDLPVDRLYAFAKTGVPVLFGVGKSYGNLTESDLDMNCCTALSSEVQKLRDELDARCGGTAAVLESPFVGLMIPYIMSEGQLKTVALLNARIDEQGPLSIRLHGVPTDVHAAVWHELRRPPVKLPIELENGCLRVVIPKIDAWNGGYLSF